MRNLPNLTSIHSDGTSFMYPRNVTVENIPNLQNINLPGAFQKVQSRSVLNISSQLNSILPIPCGELSTIDTTITSIIMPTYSCIDASLKTLNLTRFTKIESIEIENDCFVAVETFLIDGLNELKTINIGNDSFCQNHYGKKQWKSFHILNCESLESIQIGEWSFSDFSGDFELKNLPQLQSIQIGKIGRGSGNFHYSSFVVQDLPSLQSITLGDHAFRYSQSTIMENLPSLESIQLGPDALLGDRLYRSSVTMRDLPSLTSITSEGVSFMNPSIVTLENIPNVQYVKLPWAFDKVTTKTISNVSSILADLVP